MEISAEEVPIDPKTNKHYIRSAPSFVERYVKDSSSSIASARPPRAHPYTAESLATFLGMVISDGRPSKPFSAAFQALELIEGGYLAEAAVKGLGTYQLYEMTAALRKQRDAAMRRVRFQTLGGREGIVVPFGRCGRRRGTPAPG